MSNRDMPPADNRAPEKDAVVSEEKPAAQAPAKEPVREIAVTALREGFYGHQRMKPGQKFKVKSFEQLGSWMKCDDPKIEAKREKPKIQQVRKIIPRAGK